MEALSHLLLTYKYAIMLPVAIVEGPMVITLAAFLASLHLLNIYLVFLIGALGDIIGDLVFYGVGRYGHYTIISKYGHYIGITEERIKYAETHYENHLVKSILFGKITLAPNMLILVTAGVVRTDLKRYLAVIIPVALGKALIFAALGYYFGQSYLLIEQYFNNSVIALSIVGVVVIIAGLVYYKLKNRPQ